MRRRARRRKEKELALRELYIELARALKTVNLDFDIDLIISIH